ncbi:MAG: hypothetical protein QM784_00025 [Polyangiaceae bacterium]
MNTVGLGIDIGAESIKLAVVESGPGQLSVRSILSRAHQKEPERVLKEMLCDGGFGDIDRVAVTGRLHSLVRAYRVPSKAALRRGARELRPELARMTVLSIGAHGFAVLELSGKGQDHFPAELPLLSGDWQLPHAVGRALRIEHRGGESAVRGRHRPMCPFGSMSRHFEDRHDSPGEQR